MVRSSEAARLTILSIPRGPSDVRTASATALAATMLLSRTLRAGISHDSAGLAMLRVRWAHGGIARRCACPHTGECRTRVTHLFS